MDNENRDNNKNTDTPMAMETQESTDINKEPYDGASRTATTGSIADNFNSGLKDQDVLARNNYNDNGEIAMSAKESTKKVYIKENLNDNVSKLQYEIKKLRVQQKLLLRESDQYKKVLTETSNHMRNANNDNDQTKSINH